MPARSGFIRVTARNNDALIISVIDVAMVVEFGKLPVIHLRGMPLMVMVMVSFSELETLIAASSGSVLKSGHPPPTPGTCNTSR